MDSDLPSPTQENNELKAEFRKLTNEAANRKYRRRSSVDGSSDEGSPKHGSKNDDGLDDKSFNRRSDSYKHSSKGYHHRHDDRSRHGKHADEDDRIYAKLSSRLGRESRGGIHADYKDRESDYSRSRGHYRDADRYSRDRPDADRKYKDKDLDRYDGDRKYKGRDLDRTGYDGRHGSRYDDRDRHAKDRVDQEEKRDYRSYRDRRSNRALPYEDSRGHRSDTSSKREMGDMKELGGAKPSKEGKSKNDELDRCESKNQGDSSAFLSEGIAAKKPKICLEESDAWKDERQTSGSKQGEELVTKVTSDQDISAPAANVDAAKVAAMKAAELVNQNLIGTGFMTTDQKKRLLWGPKKNNNTEESSHRWDTALFSDHERQEKFNKLMGVKGDVKVDSRLPSSQDAEKQKELQLDLEKQYTAGLRRRDGRTVGLGL